MTWIACTERLPRIARAVMVYAARTGTTMVAWRQDRTNWGTHGGHLTSVTHWRPPPKLRKRGRT